MDRAVAAYRTSSPADGRFAVGWESVQGQIAWIDKYDASWGHGLVWRSAEAEAAASDWIVMYQRKKRREAHPGMAVLGLAVEHPSNRAKPGRGTGLGGSGCRG